MDSCASFATGARRSLKRWDCALVPPACWANAAGSVHQHLAKQFLDLAATASLQSHRERGVICDQRPAGGIRHNAAPPGNAGVRG
jgi:hypothetical protein